MTEPDTAFDFEGTAELLMREHAERTSDDVVRDAIVLQLRRAYEAGVLDAARHLRDASVVDAKRYTRTEGDA